MTIIRMFCSSVAVVLAIAACVAGAPVQIQDENIGTNNAVYSQPELAEALARTYEAIEWQRNDERDEETGNGRSINLDRTGGENLVRNLDHLGGGNLLRSADEAKDENLVRKREQERSRRSDERSRNLDHLGGGNLLRNLDHLGGGNLLRNLDHLGGGNLLRNLDRTGGGNLIRDSDSAKVGHLVRKEERERGQRSDEREDKTGNEKWRNSFHLGGGSLRGNLDHIGGGNLLRKFQSDESDADSENPDTNRGNLDSIGGGNLLRRVVFGVDQPELDLDLVGHEDPFREMNTAPYRPSRSAQQSSQCIPTGIAGQCDRIIWRKKSTSDADKSASWPPHRGTLDSIGGGHLIRRAIDSAAGRVINVERIGGANF